MELEIINKLFLELSQIATAKTMRELALESENQILAGFINREMKMTADDPRIEKLNLAIAATKPE